MAAPKRAGSDCPSRPNVTFAKPSASALPRSSRSDQLYAASTGQINWLQLTLQKTECPTQADINGFSALHTAALFGRMDCLQMLVEKYNVSVDLASLTGWRPIHLVMSKESGNRALECLQYLISKSADVNVQSQNGVSPLHKAASEGRTKCARLLVEAGADVHAKDKEGQEPIDLCKMWGHKECARYLSFAMWKIDKRNLFQDVSRLDEIKRECQAREKESLRRKQKELDHFNNVVFSEWLGKKRLPPPSARILSFLEKRAPSVILAQQRERWGSLSPTTSSLEEGSWSGTFGELQPWNMSPKPASQPATRIFRPDTVRLGVSPEPSEDHDFSSFLTLLKNEHGEHEIQIGKSGRVLLLPALPSEIIQRSLYPHAWPSRLKVPQDLKPWHIFDMPRKRPPSPEHRWTDQMAMSLRQTLDPAFMATLKAHLATYSDVEVELDSQHRGSREPSSPVLSSGKNSFH